MSNQPLQLEFADDIDEEPVEVERNLCPACQASPLTNADGTPRTFLLTIEEGEVFLRCPVEGCEGAGPFDCIDEPAEVTWAEGAPAIPVTVAVESSCGGKPGGYHWNGYCDHDRLFTLRPAGLWAQPPRASVQGEATR